MAAAARVAGQPAFPDTLDIRVRLNRISGQSEDGELSKRSHESHSSDSGPQPTADTDYWTQENLEHHVEGFKNLNLPLAQWAPHASHIATTVWFCRRLPLPDAEATMVEGIPALNAANGVPPDAYHDTITRFFVRIIFSLVEKLDQGQDDGELAQAIIKQIGTTKAERMALFGRYWADPVAVLMSPAARKSWVPPDLPEMTL